MFEQNTGGVSLRAVPIVGALTALAIPLVSGAFLVSAIFLILPYTAFVPVVVLGFVANAANLVLVLLVLRSRAVPIWWPVWVRPLLETAAIFSGMYLSTVTVLLAWFSRLGL